MKYLASLPSLVAAFCLSAPVSGLSHDHHDSDHHRGSSFSFYQSCPSYYGGYPYYYGGYPYAYGSSFGLTLSSRPSYYSEYSSYRGIPRSSGYEDDLVVDVQRGLARLGYYHGRIDGDLGPATRAAIRRYQYERHLEVTGRIDRSFLNHFR